MELGEANSDQASTPVGMFPTKLQGLLAEPRLKARALPTALAVAVLESSLAESPNALPEVRHGTVRECQFAGNVGQRLALPMTSDDLLANRLGDGGGHGFPPGDRGLPARPDHLRKSLLLQNTSHITLQHVTTRGRPTGE
jgi:hypothetical protein